MREELRKDLILDIRKLEEEIKDKIKEKVKGQGKIIKKEIEEIKELKEKQIKYKEERRQR